MFNPFKWLDGVLLGVAQKFCDKFQRLTGLTKFKLQKWATVVSVVFYWEYIVLESRFDSGFTIIVLVNTFSAIFGVLQAEKEEAEFLANGILTFSICHNPLARTIAGFVGGLAIALSLSVSCLTLACGVFCFVAWAYFSACIPRPPSKSTMREWYEKVLWRLNDMLQPPPEPVSNR